jgi:hypothetical protein
MVVIYEYSHMVVIYECSHMVVMYECSHMVVMYECSHMVMIYEYSHMVVISQKHLQCIYIFSSTQAITNHTSSSSMPHSMRTCVALKFRVLSYM